MELDRIVHTLTETMLWNAAQFVVGGVVAVALCAALRGSLPRSWRHEAGAGRTGSGIVLVAVFAFCGVVLPAGTYGVLPIAAVLAAAGLAVPASVAFLIANRFFNMLVSFTDPTFIWRTGYGRAILAIAAGVAAGLLFLVRRDSSRSILRTRSALTEDKPRLTTRSAAWLVGALAWKAATALAAGSILDVLYRGSVLGNIVGFLFTNPVTGPLASSFAQRNVVNPVFLLGMGCVTVVTDFVGLSGLALVVKVKGLVLYVVYGVALAVVLGCSALIP
jgi:hypothetical protein